jgi:hypothetical protein
MIHAAKNPKTGKETWIFTRLGPSGSYLPVVVLKDATDEQVEIAADLRDLCGLLCRLSGWRPLPCTLEQPQRVTGSEGLTLLPLLTSVQSLLFARPHRYATPTRLRETTCEGEGVAGAASFCESGVPCGCGFCALCPSMSSQTRL